MERNKRWIPGVLAGLTFVISYVFVLYKYEMLTSLHISLTITISAIIISGIMAWGMSKRSAFWGGVIVIAFCLIMLCLGRLDWQLLMVYAVTGICSGMAVRLFINGLDKHLKLSLIIRCLFCLSVILAGLSIGRFCLYNKSIQDFTSIYEMGSTKSLDGKYKITSFMYDSEEGNKYTVFVRMKDLESNKARNIYLEEQESMDVNMKWLGDDIVRVNGRKIHINKEVYDGRDQ